MATAYAQNGGPISTTAPVATIVTAAVDTPVTILPGLPRGALLPPPLHL